MKKEEFQELFYKHWDKLKEVDEKQAIHMLDQCKEFLKDTLVAYDNNMKKNQFVVTLILAFLSYLASVTIKDLSGGTGTGSWSIFFLVCAWVMVLVPIIQFVKGHRPVDINAPGNTPAWFFSHDGDYLERPFSHLVLMEFYSYQERIEENLQLAKDLTLRVRAKMIYLGLSVAFYLLYLFSSL